MVKKMLKSEKQTQYFPPHGGIQHALPPGRGFMLSDNQALRNVKNPSSVCRACDVFYRVITMEPPRDARGTPAEIVVSFCSMDLLWMRPQLKRLEEHNVTVQRITIYSKCGNTVINPLERSDFGRILVQIVPHENIGRCDHTYAYHVARNFNRLLPVTIFVKDSFYGGSNVNSANLRLPLWMLATGALQDPFTRQISTAFHKHDRGGFYCGELPYEDKFSWAHRPSLGSFHVGSYETKHDQNIRMGSEKGHRGGSESRASQLFSNPRYPNQHSFWKSFLPPGIWATLNNTEVVPLCYGGTFAVRRDRLRRDGLTAADWSTIAESMNRADNVVESHYMERSWGALLAHADLVGGPKASTYGSELLCAASHINIGGPDAGVMQSCQCNPADKCIDVSKKLKSPS
mmetsp:Transcript_38811/g.86727  ORF Transcript_38811/g.86727 Transcript_38811/m.86727 type:complete len:402 (-) Transcript_38811:240-1445(-)